MNNLVVENNKKFPLGFYIGIIFISLFLCLAQTGSVQAAPSSTVTGIRSSQNADKVRIVFDVSQFPAYSTASSDNPRQLTVTLPAAVNKSKVMELSFNDPVVEKAQFIQEAEQLRVVIALRADYRQQVFTLGGPNRLVIDIIKSGEQKQVDTLAQGFTYTHLTSEEPISAHILDIDPACGFTIKPVLSNDAINGLATLSNMSASSQALAAVNGSYFGLDGTIIGLLKMNKAIVSTPKLPRTVFGCFNGSFAIDQVNYEGNVELPGGKKIAIQGVNRERGADELILFNNAYGPSSGTNAYGMEYILQEGKVVAKNISNSQLSADTIVLSAHGASAQALAAVKVGDQLTVRQTLGSVWDNAVDALGAGPMLLKDGELFLTAEQEEFPVDVAVGRAPRTAAGITAKGHILLVVVDGRQACSRGMTLAEMAQFMKKLGAKDAINLDGGGSSEMIVKNQVVNCPSDGHERRVGDALAVFPAAAATKS